MNSLNTTSGKKNITGLLETDSCHFLVNYIEMEME